MADGIGRYYWGVQITHGPLYIPAIFFCTFLPGCAALFLLARALNRAVTILERRQIQFLILGSASFFVLVLTLSVALPVSGNFAIPRFGGEFALIQASLVYVALRRYRLMAIGVEDVAGDLFSNTSDGIVIVDDEGVVLHANPLACRILGLAEARGGARERLEARLPGYTHDGSYTGARFEVTRGEERRTLSLSQSSFGSDGGSRGRIVLFRDITARERAARELEEAQRQRTEAARHAGMAEVATSVLHNVGNLLNSINVSGGVVLERLQGSSLRYLRSLVELVGEREDDFPRFVAEDPRGGTLPEFIRKVARQLETEQATMLEESRRLMGLIDHIKEIVSLQQFHASGAGLVEAVELAEVVETALRIDASSLERLGIDLRRSGSRDLTVRTDRHKVMQILVNLVRNAKQALCAGNGSEKVLEVSLEERPGEVRIEVSDTGVGITPEQMKALFTFGYTTKPDGHGFGLHHAALCARELGGELSARSDGEGRGACFTLTLPAADGTEPEPEGSHRRGAEDAEGKRG